MENKYCYTKYMSQNTWRKIGNGLVIALIIVVAGKIIIDKKIGSIKVPPKGEEIVTTEGEEVDFLKLPDGFKATYYARGLDGARVMEWDPKGRMIISQTGEGKISVVEDADGDGIAENVETLLSGLDKPHGLAMRCNPVGNPSCHLYVAEHGALSRYTYDEEKIEATDRIELLTLPKSAGDRHYTRTLLFLGAPNENTLLISVGSSCNVCDEDDDMRGRVIAYDIETNEHREYARGLRNAVFMTLDPLSGNVFMTEMGRDGLGDDTPPDEINKIDVKSETAPNFGWPTCYGKNIHDSEFDKKTYIRNPCMEPFETPSFINLQAHSAPLGLSFIPEEGWDEDYWYDLLIAYHGSWNRSEPTGYKIVRAKMDTKGMYSETTDFITGWLTPSGEKLGRPADIKVMPGGTIYITDDLSGVVYRISKQI